MGQEEVEPTPYGPIMRLIYFLAERAEKPVIWFRESVVLPNQKKSYWYHEKFRRVPTIDQCYEDDSVCIYEANAQFKRDSLVDKGILHILRKRSDWCYMDNKHDPDACTEIFNFYKEAATNYFIKYGEMGHYQNAYFCLMKQKHRMAWERRHGPIGTGRKEDREAENV